MGTLFARSENVHGARRAFMLIPPVVGGEDSESTTKNYDSANGIERRRYAKTVQRFEHFQGIENSSHAQIIRYAPIDQMNIGPSRTILVDGVAPSAHVLPTAPPGAAGCLD